MKIWSHQGDLLSTNGHHHGAVECILTILQPELIICTASADGSVHKFHLDPTGGKLAEDSAKVLRLDGQTGTYKDLLFECPSYVL